MVVGLVLGLGACNRGTTLTDSEKVYCEGNPEGVVAAAETLGIAPVQVLTNEDIFGEEANGNPTEELKKANNGVDPIGPELELVTIRVSDDRWPTYHGQILNFIYSPLTWYSGEDLARACQAAYGAR